MGVLRKLGPRQKTRLMGLRGKSRFGPAIDVAREFVGRK
jgi:hypothetical protein